MIGSPDFERIKTIVQSLSGRQSGDSTFDGRWTDLIGQYSAWEHTSVGLHTSTTNRKLQLYEMVQSRFPELLLRTNGNLADVILSAFPRPGEMVVLVAGAPKVEVLRREITDRLGVLLTLRDPDGKIYSKEIFD
jgi:hypothetical protein